MAKPGEICEIWATDNEGKNTQLWAEPNNEADPTVFVLGTQRGETDPNVCWEITTDEARWLAARILTAADAADKTDADRTAAAQEASAALTALGAARAALVIAERRVRKLPLGS